MNTVSAAENLIQAFDRAAAVRPKVGGFPYLAEALRQAGISRNRWALPGCQAIYTTKLGPVIQQGTPLLLGLVEAPPFSEADLVAVLRRDQAGESTFPEFLQAAWEAGVVGYEVDLAARTCTYFGADGGEYVESYPAVELP